MKEEIVFLERQRFNQWWILALIAIVNGIVIYACITQIGLGKLWGNNPVSDTMLIVITVIVLLVTVCFLFVRLDTVINREGVYYRMFPYHLKFQFKPWEHISEADVMKVRPISEFGGWGMRFKILNFGGSGIHVGFGSKSYTVSGNKTLKLELKNNKKIYIGTRNPDELSAFLEKLNAERKQK